VRACYAGTLQVSTTQRVGWGAGSTHEPPQPAAAAAAAAAAPTSRVQPASEPARSYASALILDRDTSGLSDHLLDVSSAVVNEEPASKPDVSALIDALKAAPFRRALQTNGSGHNTIKVEEGMFKKDGIVYKVVRAKNNSGRLYAKKLRQDAQGTWFFDMARGMVYKLRPEDKLSAEDAAEFGKLYEICINCGRDLTRDNSIHVGYGPVCADNNGWYYPTNAELLELQAAAERQVAQKEEVDHA
jgi:hypothetical protein